MFLYPLETQLVTRCSGMCADSPGLRGSLPIHRGGLWLQQPHRPIIHLHNGCLFIHYANGMGGKLGNKGRRKEKIALAYFNILFISKHCVVFKRLNLRVACAGEFVSAFP